MIHTVWLVSHLVVSYTLTRPQSLTLGGYSLGPGTSQVSQPSSKVKQNDAKLPQVGATHGIRSSLGSWEGKEVQVGSVVGETRDAEVGEQEFPMVVAPEDFQA